MNQRRRAMALLVVMVIVTLVALAAYGFNQQMTDAYRASQLQVERAQARLTAMSGIEALRAAIDQPRGTRLTWHRDAAETFTAVPIQADTGGSETDEPSWSFSVLAPSVPKTTEDQLKSSTSWRFGLTNESSKINLNVLNEWAQAEPGQATGALMNLPGMDLPMAQALMRAYDINDTSSSSATSLSDRIGAFASENTEGIRGDASGSGNGAIQWNRRWARRWTGGDWDHNYQLDTLEQNLIQESSSLSQASAIDAPAIAVPPAWRNYLTFDSRQKNESLDGRPRVFLNGSDLQKLHQDLLTIWPADWAGFVIAVRQFGLAQNRGSRSGSTSVASAGWTPDLSIAAAVRITSPLELVGATVEVPQSKGKPLRIRSPFSTQRSASDNDLARLLDEVTVSPGPVIVGQVDIMEAPRPVLLGVPKMSEETADRIIGRRGSQSDSGSPSGPGASRRTIAWLLTENVVDLNTLIQLQPWITVGGDCYQGQVVAFRDPLSPIFRCTVTLDATAPGVAVRNFRRWDAWGKGFRIDDLRGLESSQSGTSHPDLLP